MKNPFLRIFHLADYQVVTSATKHLYGNPRKTLIFCILQVLAKDYEHAHRKYWLIGQNAHICSSVLKKHLHVNTRNHPERSNESPHWQNWLKKIVAMVSMQPPLQEKIFGLSIFLFAQNLWYAVTKNGDLDSTMRTAKSPFKKGAPEICANKKEKTEIIDLLLKRRLPTLPPK